MESMTTAHYAHESVDRLIKLLVAKGLIEEADRKAIHEGIVADFNKQQTGAQ